MLLKEWGLLFRESDGPENRYTVAKAFANFWKNSDINILNIPGKCILGGKVYGQRDYKDGDDILSSELKTIERVDGISNTRPMLKAVAVDGSVYYFAISTCSMQMRFMLNDLLYRGGIRSGPNQYLDEKYQNTGFL